MRSILTLAALVLAPLLAAQTPAPRVCLLPGDTESAAAVAAVAELRADPALAGIEFHVFANPAQCEINRAILDDATLVLANTHGRDLAKTVAPATTAIRARGGHVWAVGSTFDNDFGALGFERDDVLTAYFSASGRANLANMVRCALARTLRPGLPFAPPVEVPRIAYYEIGSARFFERHEDFAAAYLAGHPERAGRPWVGLMFARGLAVCEQTAPLRAIAGALEARGYNVLPVFGWPGPEVVERCFIDESGRSRIEALVGMSLKTGNVPEKIVPMLARLGVPVVNAITLYSQTRAEWESSPVGLDQVERSWQVAAAELAGTIAPTVVASKERELDPATGLYFSRFLPIPERVERLADRIDRWVRLRRLANSEKKVAVIYYNYPPGRENVGASYLNVLPGSLWQILGRLRREGFAVSGQPDSPAALFSAVRDFASNGRAGNADDLDRIVRGGHAVLWPVAEYRKYFDTLPAELRDSIVAKWGQPETSRTMLWRDPEGHPFFVFPVLRWGNVLYAPQPTRGWDQDISAVYHDLHLPLHHQYLAFYLWLQHEFAADAMVHVGTHATHEWQSGKEVGFTAADPGEVLVGAVPQLYPYIVDNIGEGQQAKRRGMAVVISHLTPPLDKASLNPELKALTGLITDYRLAHERGSITGDANLQEIAARATKMGLLKDLAIELQPDQRLDDHQIESLEDHIKDIGEKYAPFGLHTFGVSPDERMRAATAEAVLSIETTLSPEEHARRKAALMADIEASGRAELDALVAGLAGRYIAAGPGNDPIRSPASLPTGKNFYGFDPGRLPTPASYAAGERLARDMVEQYRQRHAGAAPERLVFNLWATETNRHEGAMEAQILWLLGVKPKWDARGRVEGVELIPREELGRPRIDVTVTPSGLYRDLFPPLVLLIDQAVDAVKQSREADNPVLAHIATTRAALEARGLPAADAERIASVRIFTEPPGVYGNGVANAAFASGSWDNEKQIADVYFNRMGHLFGQGFWGERPTHDGKDLDLAKDVFRLALKDVQGVVHSRSTNTYAALDNDDFFQYLGGAAMAVRQVNGTTPEVLVADLSNPKGGETVTLDKFMGKEMRSRYLNPKWIKAMLDEGYAGARFVMQVTDNLWGWQVTVPEAVDGAKWQEMYEVYVQDRYQLDVRKKFEAAGNLRAYQAMVDRMLVAVDKGYWNAVPETVKGLREASAQAAQQIAAEEAVEKTALANAPLPDTAKLLAPAPAVAPAPAPAPAASSAQPQAAPKPSTPPPPARAQPPPAAAKPLPAATPPPPAAASQAKPAATKQPAQVQGKVLEEVSSKKNNAPVLTPARLALGTFAGLAAVLALVAFGWWRQGRKT